MPGCLEINGSPTDAAAGLIKKGIHEGLADGGYQTLAEYDTPDWAPPKAQQWASGQVSRFGKKIVGVVAANDGTGGAAIAALKAAGVNPVPPVTGNDATIAGLPAHHRRGPIQHDLQAERDRRGGGRRCRGRVAFGRDARRRTLRCSARPTKLFTPALVTAQNLKAEIVDKTVNGKPIETAKVLCTGRYAADCKKLGIE